MFVFQLEAGVKLDIRQSENPENKLQLDLSRALQESGWKIGSQLQKQQSDKLIGSLQSFLKTDADTQKFFDGLLKAGIAVDDNAMLKIATNTVNWLVGLVAGDMGKSLANCLMIKICTEVYTIKTGNADKLLSAPDIEAFRKEFDRVTYYGASSDAERVSLRIIGQALLLYGQMSLSAGKTSEPAYERYASAVRAAINYAKTALRAQEEQHNRGRNAKIIAEHEKQEFI